MTEPPPPFAIIAGGETGVHTGLNAAAAVRVMTSPLGMERTPPTGKLRPLQLRPLLAAMSGVVPGVAVVVTVTSATICRRSIVGMVLRAAFRLFNSHCAIAMEVVKHVVLAADGFLSPG